MTELRVLLDADGVVVDFNRGWKSIASQRLGCQVPIKQRTWKPFMEGVDLVATIESIMAEPDVWRDSPCYPSVVAKLHALRDFGVRFFVVTSIRAQYADVRLEWLKRHHIPFEEMVVTSCAADKVKAAKALGLTVAIDDNQENARMLHDAGLHTFLLARWWNEAEPGLERITWRTLPRRLVELSMANTERMLTAA